MVEAQTAPGLTLELSRVFQAPQEAVFRAWIDENHLRRWWGPKGFTAHIDEFEPRPGGAYRIDMRDSGGDSHWVHGVFKAVDPHDRLVMNWIWEQGDLAELVMLVTVEFTAMGNATEVKLTHANLPSEAARDAHSGGWTSSLECLAEQF